MERLRACTGLLKQQAKELEAELQWLQFHPRYAALLVEGPFGLPCPIDGPGEAERLDAIIESLDAAVQRLSSSEGLQEVRAAIRAYRDAERETAQRRR